MRIWSLGSGSSGNCYLLLEGNTALLLEAGLSMARVLRELDRLGVSSSRVAAVVASHEHTDHWSAAMALARRLRIPVVCTPGTWQAGAPCCSSVQHEPLLSGRPLDFGPLSVEAFPVPHDARQPVGLFIRNGHGASICLATDMGVATQEVIERARAADLVILEANHDQEMLIRGPYPAALKARILGEQGHLSNDAAAQAIVRIASGRPRRFWLAHLSRTNNSPRVALSSVQRVLYRQGLGNLDVAVALRDRTSLFWDSNGHEMLVQMRLFEDAVAAKLTRG